MNSLAPKICPTCSRKLIAQNVSVYCPTCRRWFCMNDPRLDKIFLNDAIIKEQFSLFDESPTA